MLFIVPTPIGNLEDITLRALETLKKVDVIACEDSRRTLALLSRFGIQKPLRSYHAHSGERREAELMQLLQSGKHMALVCDSGTPGISDPGAPLIRKAIEAKIPVVSLPGPCAFVTALAGSGLPTDRFTFLGFLPRRAARARRMLREAAAPAHTVIFHESPFRVAESLALVQEIAGTEAPVVVAREITKLYEEYLRGTAEEVLAKVRGQTLKGEVTILFYMGSSLRGTT